jgi:hypothetical protein
MMIKLTATQEIMPYKWVHPDLERWKSGKRNETGGLPQRYWRWLDFDHQQQAP